MWSLSTKHPLGGDGQIKSHSFTRSTSPVSNPDPQVRKSEALPHDLAGAPLELRKVKSVHFFLSVKLVCITINQSLGSINNNRIPARCMTLCVLAFVGVGFLKSIMSLSSRQQCSREKIIA